MRMILLAAALVVALPAVAETVALQCGEVFDSKSARLVGARTIVTIDGRINQVLLGRLRREDAAGRLHHRARPRRRGRRRTCAMRSTRAWSKGRASSPPASRSPPPAATPTRPTASTRALAPARPARPDRGRDQRPDDARQAVRQRYKDGSDVIKITATGGVLSYAKSGDAPQFMVDEIRAIVDTARDYGYKVAAHAHGKEGMKRAVRPA
jgi:hypothetical protein